jgi:hypothetical protein
MTHTFQHGAKIYQFPVGGRASLGRNREEIKSDLGPQQVAAVAIGDGWYHEEAIKESNQAREH